jgi:glycosyltransferase involved in cell wall biosynthesis
VTPQLWLFDEARVIGGGQIFALRLGAFLADNGGPPLRIVAPAGSGMRERCADAGIEWTAAEFPSIGPTGLPRWPAAVAEMRRLMRSAGADAVVVANAPRAQACLFAAATVPGTRPPIVDVIHEMETLGRPSGRYAYRRADGIVAIGERVAAACRSQLTGKEVQQANVFVNWDEIGPASPPPGNARPALGVLGRLIPEKGQLELVEDLAEAEGSWSRLVLAGAREDEGYARALESRITDLGLGERIALAGHLEDTSSFFAEIDALVFPSTGTEGQGMTIVEALAHGRPAVVRRNVFSPGDYAGLPVFPYEGAAELGRALGELPQGEPPLDELRRRFGPEQALEAILLAAGQRG